MIWLCRSPIAVGSEEGFYLPMIVVTTCPVPSARIYRPSFHENKPKTLVFT